MENVGIIICDRYRRCAGGTPARPARQGRALAATPPTPNLSWSDSRPAMVARAGTSNTPQTRCRKMAPKSFGLATGMLVGYPPCPHIADVQAAFLEKSYPVMVVGTHPIPNKYLNTHTCLGTWESPEWKPLVEAVLSDDATRAVTIDRRRTMHARQPHRDDGSRTRVPISEGLMDQSLFAALEALALMLFPFSWAAFLYVYMVRKRLSGGK